MLTDAALKNLKSKDKPYKVTDRDGMYVRVGTNGTISFRYDYRVNGRRETVTFGKYGSSGLSLARAREKCIDAKRMIQEGLSPAIEKQREKRRIAVSEQTYYRWRKEYGGLKTDQARRMKDLEKENVRLRRAISDLTLDKLILQEAARGNF